MPVDCSPSVAPADILLENSTISPDGLSSVSARDIGRPGDGLLIIIPDMAFSCYGFVSSWTGILSLDTNSLPYEEFIVHLQVWRPVGNGTFDLVGSMPLVLNSTTIGEELQTVVGGDTYYHQFMGTDIAWSAAASDNDLAFQPGDVVGCFIPATKSLSASLGLAFRNGSGQIGHGASGAGGGVELLVYPVDGDICEATVAVCEGSQVVLSSVQPQLYPHQECK